MTGPGAACTSGFAFINQNLTLKASTAGHCVAGMPTATHTSTEFGQQTVGSMFVQSTAAQGIDVALYDVDDRSLWYPQGTVLRAADNNAPVTGSQTKLAAVIGTQLCKSGFKTFINHNVLEHCGTLVAKNATSAQNIASLGAVQPCLSDVGDSGAAVYSQTVNTVAYGIHKGHGEHNSIHSCFFSFTSDASDLWGYWPLISPLKRRGDFRLLTDPAREVDSRVNSRLNGPFSGSTSLAPLTWASATPYATANVQGVVVNVTVANPTAAGWVTLWAWDPTKPNNGMPATSTTNYGANQTRASTTIVPVGPSGLIGLYSSVATHLIMDVGGYVVAPTTLNEAGLVSPVRAHNFVCAANTNCWKSITAPGIPANATGYLLNITAIPQEDVPLSVEVRW